MDDATLRTLEMEAYFAVLTVMARKPLDWVSIRKLNLPSPVRRRAPVGLFYLEHLSTEPTAEALFHARLGAFGSCFRVVGQLWLRLLRRACLCVANCCMLRQQQASTLQQLLRVQCVRCCAVTFSLQNKERLLTDLREELHISTDDHRKTLEGVQAASRQAPDGGPTGRYQRLLAHSKSVSARSSTVRVTPLMRFGLAGQLCLVAQVGCLQGLCH